MSWELILRHCAATRATVQQTEVSLQLVLAQIAGIEALAKVEHEREQAPRARVERPATCTGYKTEDCARLTDEAALEMGGMGGGPVTVMCRGCGQSSQKS